MKHITRFSWLWVALSCSYLFFCLSASAVGAATKDGLIPESLIHLNGGDIPGYALVVEKKSQILRVYAFDGEYRLKHRFACSTGEGAGKKKFPGDRKTPEGVYFFTASFEKRYLSSTYGNRAFVMDYPNVLDRMNDRGGDNIWLHGTNKKLRPRATNGCVVVENGDIDVLAGYIRLNHTPIIIKEELQMVSPGQHAAKAESLRRFLKDWKSALLSADKARHDSFYMNPSPAHDRFWEAWVPMHDAWAETQAAYAMSLKHIAIGRANPCLVVLLDQSVQLGDHRAGAGRKKLFVKRQGTDWKIMAETYQGVPVQEDKPDPLILSWQRLERLNRDYKDVARRVAEWAEAWSAKDIDGYRACYAREFRSRGMDLSAWIRYKDRLNKRYDFITVSVEDLQIRQNGDRSTATFVQRYRSSGHESVGTKRLRLRRTDGAWKIDREKWLGKIN